MKWKAITSILLVFSTCFSIDSRHFLQGRIPENNHRYETFLEALELCEKRNAKTLVETGTARHGDTDFGYWWNGSSTIFFADWAREHNRKFYSVDIDNEALIEAAKGMEYNLKSVDLVHSDSVTFLENFGKQIDFLYLDSYDFDENDPAPSQQHHLKEIIAAYPWLTKKSVILIDDCDLPHGGKGKLVIPYLENRGWKVHKKGYQVLLIKDEKPSFFQNVLKLFK